MASPADLGLSAAPGGCRLAVRVAPRSSANRLLGAYSGALKVALTAPPVDGAANKALIEFLAHLLDVPRGEIDIESGATGRTKVLFVGGLTAEVALAKLRAAIDAKTS